MVLGFEPHNPFAWALWRDGLEAQGALAAAEEVGWEALRRYPENPQWRTQLATVLVHAGRADEAAALLRETIALFPGNVIARNQLAIVLGERLGDPQGTAGLLREMIALFPGDAPARNQLATVLARRLSDPQGAIAVLEAAIAALSTDAYTYNFLAILMNNTRGDRAGAATVLRAGQAAGLADEVTAELQQQLHEGRRQLRHQSTRAPQATGLAVTAAAAVQFDLSREFTDPAQATGVAVPEAAAQVDLPDARARRALFRAECGDDRAAGLAEVRRLLDEDGASAYTRYVARRTGVVSGDGMGHVFAYAFDRAAQAGSGAALRALLDHAQGADRYVVRSAQALMAGDAESPAVLGANDIDAGSALRRFAGVAGTINGALRGGHADHSAMLRLLRDFAAAELSAA
ncbi:MAG: tetratricopeptide repeat protein [Alphaproteobacteria bacterium]|nr:tetratricopeptide repeat protein [Alphaproteobacteria bacterium]